MYSSYTKKRIIDFVTEHGEDIKNAIINTGLWFPAVVAQLTVESQFGDSSLASDYNNYGGIKGSGNGANGGSITLDTTEGNSRSAAVQRFATYRDFKSFMDSYMSTLRNPRYVNAGVFNSASPEEQIANMVKAGYSTMTPSAYLANGTGDRINAVRDIYGIGKIDSNAAYANNRIISDIMNPSWITTKLKIF